MFCAAHIKAYMAPGSKLLQLQWLQMCTPHTHINIGIYEEGGEEKEEGGVEKGWCRLNML
jgi:hypothetical protein